MIHKMMISEDCGIHYYEAARSENPKDFAAKIQECERDMLRWVIEDERGEITHLSGIHLGILDALHAANAPRQPETAGDGLNADVGGEVTP